MARLLNAERGPRAWLDLDDPPGDQLLLVLRLHGALGSLAPAAGEAVTLLADVAPGAERFHLSGLRVSSSHPGRGLVFEPAPYPAGMSWRDARALAAAWRHAPMRVSRGAGRLVLRAAWWRRDPAPPVLLFEPDTHASLANAVARAAAYHTWVHGAGDAALLAHTRPGTWAPPERLAAAGRQLPFASDLGAGKDRPNAAASLMVLHKAVLATGSRGADRVALQLKPAQQLYVMDCYPLLRALFDRTSWSLRADDQGAVFRSGGPWDLRFGDETIAELSAEQQTLTWTRARESAFAWEEAARAEVAPLHGRVWCLGRFRRLGQTDWEIELLRPAASPAPLVLRAVPPHQGMPGLARISLFPGASDFETRAQTLASWLPAPVSELLNADQLICTRFAPDAVSLARAPEPPWRSSFCPDGAWRLVRAEPWRGAPPFARGAWDASFEELRPDPSGDVQICLDHDADGRTVLLCSPGPGAGPAAWASGGDVFISASAALRFHPAATVQLERDAVERSVCEVRLHVPVGDSPEAASWVRRLARSFDSDDLQWSWDGLVLRRCSRQPPGLLVTSDDLCVADPLRAVARDCPGAPVPLFTAEPGAEVGLVWAVGAGIFADAASGADSGATVNPKAKWVARRPGTYHALSRGAAPQPFPRLHGTCAPLAGVVPAVPAARWLLPIENSRLHETRAAMLGAPPEVLTELAADAGLDARFEHAGLSLLLTSSPGLPGVTAALRGVRELRRMLAQVRASAAAAEAVEEH
jgi:hypothetical protein